jgi:TctA family transporter
MLDTILSGLAHLGTFSYWGAVLVGVFIAALIGLLPGVGTPMVMALAIPFILFTIQDPLIGIVLLATIGGVSSSLDSVPAILLGYPGASTQVTFIEGHQLAEQGKAAHTLGATYAVAGLGGIVGAIALVIVIPVIRPFILNFSYSEIAAMAIFGLAMVSILSAGAMLKGIAAGMIGLFLSTIGIHWGTGTERFTFGDLNLSEGLPMIAMTLGIFAVPEVLDLSATGRAVSSKATAVISVREVWEGAKAGMRRWRITVRHSLFGVFLGMVPGIGGAVIDWLSYALGVALSKDKSEFGKGSLDGVIFAESAQNSKEGGQAVPTLAFGVPGGLSWVFILYAMLAYNIAPGPQMLGRYADITIMIAVSFGIANLIMVLIGLGFTAQLAKLTVIPYAAIAAVIVPISFLSAFQSGDGWFGILVLLIFAPIGLMMKAFRWPRSPLILGFILGGVIEQNLQSALSAYGPISFVTRPITLVLIVITIVTTVWLLRLNRSSAHQPTEVVADSVGAASVLAKTDSESKIRLSVRGPWRAEHWFSLGALLLACAAIIGSMSYAPSARFFPIASCSVVIALMLYQLVFGRAKTTGQIMDIGLRSMEVPAARRNALIIGVGIVLYMLLTLTIGLMVASVLFAACFPFVMMKGRSRFITSAIATVILIIMAYGLLDYYMGVYWPEPYIGDWIKSIV